MTEFFNNHPVGAIILLAVTYLLAIMYLPLWVLVVGCFWFAIIAYLNGSDS